MTLSLFQISNDDNHQPQVNAQRPSGGRCALMSAIKKMRHSLLSLTLIFASCASQKINIESPTSEIILRFDPGSENQSAVYEIYTKGDHKLGEVESIVDASVTSRVSGLPVEQMVYWSATGKTALIYENMSDASPDYRHVILRFHHDYQVFSKYVVDLGTRYPPQPTPVVYGQWPTVIGISDDAIHLEWDTEPNQTTVLINDLIFESIKISEQDAAQASPDHVAVFTKEL